MAKVTGWAGIINGDGILSEVWPYDAIARAALCRRNDKSECEVVELVIETRRSGDQQPAVSESQSPGLPNSGAWRIKRSIRRWLVRERISIRDELRGPEDSESQWWRAIR